VSQLIIKYPLGAEVYSTLSLGFILIPSRFKVFFPLSLNGDK